MNSVIKAVGALMLVALAGVVQAQSEKVSTTMEPGTVGTESGTSTTTTTTTTTTASAGGPL